jgi:hypothetical protein
MVPALVDPPCHNISPRLGKQLVLELERREEGAELVDGLPSSISFRQRLPLYQHMPNPAAELGTQSTSRPMENVTVV